jgi:curved DNA-binding protein CbpA
MELQRCYEVLGIQVTASPEAVHQAYKTQVKFFHPDRFTGDPDQQRLAEERLKEVNAAYETLQTIQARGPSEAPRPKASSTERSPDRSAESAGAAENPRPATAGPSGTSLVAQLRAIGERVAAGIGNALQSLRSNSLSGQQPGDPRQVGGCRRSGMGPRRSGRRMGRGGGGRRR